MRDTDARARCALFGMAIGDALGASVVGYTRGTFRKPRDIKGGGLFNVAKGSASPYLSDVWRLADLLASGVSLPSIELYDALSVQGGENFARITKIVLDNSRSSSYPLPRCIPVAIVNREFAPATWGAQYACGITVKAEATTGCAALYTAALWSAIQHGAPEQAFAYFDDRPDFGPWRGRVESQANASPYATAVTKSALWAIDSTATVEAAILAAVSLGGDACVIGALAGALAGALYGEIPNRLEAQLDPEYARAIEEMSRRLTSLPPSSSSASISPP